MQHGPAYIYKIREALPGPHEGSFSSECPEGGTRLPQAVGRGMECPVSLAGKSYRSAGLNASANRLFDTLYVASNG